MTEKLLRDLGFKYGSVAFFNYHPASSLLSLLEKDQDATALCVALGSDEFLWDEWRNEIVGVATDLSGIAPSTMDDIRFAIRLWAIVKSRPTMGLDLIAELASKERLPPLYLGVGMAAVLWSSLDGFTAIKSQLPTDGVPLEPEAVSLWETHGKGRLNVYTDPQGAQTVATT